jgi:divalent metal cation (Fe/Co/Zn/Cd) transporter
MTQTGAVLDCAEDRAEAVARRGRWLAYMTVGWMTVEASVALWAALTAGSVALLGFGGDSVIEVISGCIILWRFSGGVGESRERRAAQLIGWSLIALAAYVAFESISALTNRRTPEPTVAGIVLAAASLTMMPLLAGAKRRVAAQAGSHALAGDARQSSICAWLSGVTLLGLGLRAICGWWWADAAAALALVPLIATEGIAVFRARTIAAACCGR